MIVKAVEEFLHVPTHKSLKKLLVKRYINNPSEDCSSTHPNRFSLTSVGLHVAGESEVHVELFYSACNPDFANLQEKRKFVLF